MRVSRYRYFVMMLFAVAITFVACSDDDNSTAPQTKQRSVTSAGSQDYTSIDVTLNNFPAGTTLELRPLYWSATELTADPQARVTALSATVFRVEFLNLSQGIFADLTARILMVAVDSVVDELQGIVVLCDESGPIIISTECNGNCKPLCGFDGNTCC